MVFGPHLMLDMYNCDKEKLDDVAFITKLLDELPDVIKMHKMAPPQVLHYAGSDNPHHFDKGGVSGVVMITESHISIHTFVEQGFASMDVYSCKIFDKDAVANYAQKSLGAEKMEKKFIMRGKEFVK